MVLPTSVLISLGTASAATIERTPTVGASLRLDQIAAPYDLVRQGERGELTPAQGIERMAQIRAMPARFGLPVVVFGYVVGETEPGSRCSCPLRSAHGLVRRLLRS